MSILKIVQTLQGHRNILSISRCIVFSTPANSKLLRTTSCQTTTSKDGMFQLRHQTILDKKSSHKWTTYRMGSVALLVSMAGCFIVPGNPLVDFATVSLLVHHNHFGLKSVIADYAPLMFKPWFITILQFCLFFMSIATLGLLYVYNYNNIGFSKTLVEFSKM